jgi:hypothetical protein
MKRRRVYGMRCGRSGLRCDSAVVGGGGAVGNVGAAAILYVGVSTSRWTVGRLRLRRRPLLRVLRLFTGPRQFSVAGGYVDESVPIVHEESVGPSARGNFLHQLGQGRQMIPLCRIARKPSGFAVRKKRIIRLRSFNGTKT